MNINLHIEQLALDGLPVTGGQGALVRAAVESELTRLLAEGDMNHLRSGAAAHASASPIQLSQDPNPLSLGHQIARAIHGTLTPQSSVPKVTTRPRGATT